MPLFYYHLLYATDMPTLHPMPYEKPLPKYGEEQLIRILLDPKLDRQHVCTTWPIVVESSSTFVIDITKLKHPDDV